ncbi:hypothetical protein F5884DRAFT_406185 [Xylogone sp. PMI_703]|nr:hypothetical protein F5884DRAFT_406185 [Xylogone sp. PMI_703]
MHGSIGLRQVMEYGQLGKTKQRIQSDNRSLTIQFINVKGPSGATSADSARTIRSHAAKTNHIRTRRGRLTHLEIRQYRGPAEAVEPGHRNPPDEGNRDPTGAESVFHRAYRHDRRALCRLIDSNVWFSDPRSPLICSRGDPFQSCARAVSTAESFLIDHYMTFVVDYGYTECDHGGGQALFLRQVRSCWVPWSLTHQGLLAGILMTACRSLVALFPHITYYRVKLLKYKSECINIARAALSLEDRPCNDYTIAIALVLAAEEFMNGNTAGFSLHGKGIMKMIDMRGGRKNLGPEGFLEHLLTWSIYNPRFKLVSGPCVEIAKTKP